MVGRKFALLYVPHSGLFYRGGRFLDGEETTIAWNGSLPIFDSHSAAIVERDRLLMEKPRKYARGQLIVLSVELRSA